MATGDVSHSASKSDELFIAQMRAWRNRYQKIVAALTDAINVYEETTEVLAKPTERPAPPAITPAPPAKEPPQPAVAPKPTVTATFPKNTRQKTPERVELLRELWHRPGTPGNPAPTRKEILDALNALPGGQIPEKQLGAYAIQWGIAKSARPVPPQAATPAPEIPKTTIETRLPVPKVVPPVLRTAPEARQAVNGISAASGEPIMVDAAQAQRWGAERGIVTGKLDLERVNSKRRQLQLAPFAIRQHRGNS
jgi:hypothetical protein